MQVCIRKRALRKGALFAFWALCFVGSSAAWAGPDCRLPPANETAVVNYVHDGDTIDLEDGRKLRLIGINAPELARHNTPAEPYGEEATRRVKQLIPRHSRVDLVYGVERHDRYGRLLVHVILPDGRDLNRLLLQQGLAEAIVMPPNIRMLPCYWQAEQQARQRHEGLWQLAYFRPLEAATMSGKEQGFHLLRGRVVRVGESRKSWWLDLNGPVSIRIAKHDMQYFPHADFSKLVGHTIETRGWLHRYRSRLMMGVRHHIALRVVK